MKNRRAGGCWLIGGALLAVVTPLAQAFTPPQTVQAAAAAAPAQPPIAAIPFAGTVSIQARTGSSWAFFFRQADSTYINLQFQLTTPYLLSPMSESAQLQAGGVINLLDAPPWPAGTGPQSQTCALAALRNGSGAVACVADRDGADDFVAVYESADGISITSANYTIGQDVNSVFFADFNGDGNADIAVAYDGGTGPGGIAILLGNGAGAFGKPVTYAAGTGATEFAVSDLNHDGALDIAMVSYTGTVTVVLGKGDGTFGPAAEYATGGASLEAIAIADFNGDGVPDIAMGGTTGILLGNGNGTFRAGTPLPVPAGAGAPWALAAGDLNGDGKMDLVYADTMNQLVVPLFGRGDGTFTLGQAYAVSLGPDNLVLADFNHDGLLDIVNAAGDQRSLRPADNSGNIDILLNNGDGTFQGAPVYLPPPGSSFLQEVGFVTEANAAVSRFGGAFPSVLASTSNGAVTLFPGNGKGGFQSAQSFPIPEAGAIAAGDFNGDGKPDAAVASGSQIAVLLASASGFATPTAVSSGGLFPTAIVSGDFDGDGKLDLVFLSPGAGDASSPGTLAFLKGQGNGMFGAPVTIPAGFTPLSVSAVDLNGDGKLDLVFSDSGYVVSGTAGVGGGVYVAINSGGGVFQAPVKVFSGLYPAFGIGDVNGDGKLDLIASSVLVSSGNSVIDWLAGNGNGTFQAPIAITTSGDTTVAILVQDFSGGGNQDIVLAHPDCGTTFLAGNGDGTFSAETPFNSVSMPSLLLTTDLNGDGKPDLIVVGETMSALLNDSPPASVTIQTNPPGLQILVDEEAAQTAPQTLRLSPGPHIIGVGTPQAGTAGTQSAFKSWSDGGAGEHMIAVGTSAAAYTATFTTQYQLTISASPAADGTVTPASGTFYNSGTVVPITATASSGYTFTGWTGSVASASSSSTTVTMSAPETLTANFSSGGSGHPAFFSGEDSLGGGVYYLQFPDNNLFGYYNYPASTVIYHYDMGFEAFVPSTSGQIYFYDFASGHWWYTSSSLFPYLYDFTLNTFIYYFPDTKNMGHYTTSPRYFSNLTTGKIFTM